MSGLREKKKQESIEKILCVSKEIFLTRGYAKTTMEDIAEKAGIGVGTLYNYFPSKAEIFITIMSDEFILKEDEDEVLQNDLGHDAADIVIDFLGKSCRCINIFGKTLWRELFSATFGSMKSENMLLKGIAKIDYNFISKLEQLLKKLKERNILPQSFNEKEASYAVYSVVITQFIFYLYEDTIRFDNFTIRVEKQIRFILEGKSKR